jgi:hypothetical protein
MKNEFKTGDGYFEYEKRVIWHIKRSRQIKGTRADKENSRKRPASANVRREEDKNQ